MEIVVIIGQLIYAVAIASGLAVVADTVQWIGLTPLQEQERMSKIYAEIRRDVVLTTLLERDASERRATIAKWFGRG